MQCGLQQETRCLQYSTIRLSLLLQKDIGLKIYLTKYYDDGIVKNRDNVTEASLWL